MPLCLHISTPAARLQTSRPPIPPRLHSSSAPLYLHVPMPAACPQSSTPPCILHRYTYIAPPDHHTSIPPHLHGPTPTAPLTELHISISISLQLQCASIPPCRYTYSPPPYLYTSTPLHLQRTSRVSYLRAPTCSDLEPPELHVSMYVNCGRAYTGMVIACESKKWLGFGVVRGSNRLCHGMSFFTARAVETDRMGQTIDALLLHSTLSA